MNLALKEYLRSSVTEREWCFPMYGCWRPILIFLVGLAVLQGVFWLASCVDGSLLMFCDCLTEMILGCFFWLFG